MITLLTIVISIIALGLPFGLLKKSTYLNDNNESNPTGIAKLVGVIIIAIVLGFINPFDIERIDTGHVGIKVDQTGGNKESGIEYARGWVIYNSWISKVYEFPVYQQHVDYEEATVITKGGFQTTIKPSLNYSLNSGSVDNMFQNLRLPIKEIEQGWLRNAIVSSVNDVANTFTVDSVFNHRAEFENAILRECNKRVSNWFTVSQLRTNIVPPPALAKSIEDKTKAIQEVQVAENQRAVAIAEAERKIAEAKGDSAQAVIKAAGRAEAIKKEQLSLTALYIQYINSQKWDGHYPSVMAGNSGTILQLPAMGKE